MTPRLHLINKPEGWCKSMKPRWTTIQWYLLGTTSGRRRKKGSCAETSLWVEGPSPWTAPSCLVLSSSYLYPYITPLAEFRGLGKGEWTVLPAPKMGHLSVHFLKGVSNCRAEASLFWSRQWDHPQSFEVRLFRGNLEPLSALLTLQQNAEMFFSILALLGSDTRQLPCFVGRWLLNFWAVHFPLANSFQIFKEMAKPIFQIIQYRNP
jgi:hypothetical protein